MLPVIPYLNPNLDCYESIVASYLRWIGYDYTMLFENCWGLFFAADIDDDLPRPLEKYYGIKAKWFDVGTPLDQILTEADLKSEPLIVSTDIYDCPWIKAYRKHYFKHTLLALDIKENNLICIDPYFSNRIQSFNYEDCCEELKFGVFEEFSPRRDENPDFLLQELKKTVNSYNRADVFANVSNVERFLLLDVKTEPEYLEFSFDLIMLNKLAKNRLNFSNVLRHIGNLSKSLCFQRFIDRFEELSATWSLTRNILTRFFLCDDIKDRKRVFELLASVSDKERCLCGDLCEYLNESA